MKPLVSICIPTYNRAEYLKETIESIVVQPEFKSGEVEIVISDNASIDSTKDVCNQYSHYENFIYHKNPENIRDENFPMVLSKAHGKLRKLNNDTFVLAKNALRKLCDLARTYEEKKPFIFLHNEGNVTKELNFHDFVTDVGYWVTWLIGFTIWEDECAQIEYDTDGCELSLWQVRKAYELAHKKDAVVVYGQRLGGTITPPKKDVSYGLYKVFYCNYLGLLHPYVEKGVLAKDDVEQIEKELLFGFFLPRIMEQETINRNAQYSEKENLKTAVWEQYKNKSYWKEFEKIYKGHFSKARVKVFLKRILGIKFINRCKIFRLRVIAL